MGEKVKASAIYAEAFRLEGEVKRLQEALAAARRETTEALERAALEVKAAFEDGGVWDGLQDRIRTGKWTATAPDWSVQAGDQCSRIGCGKKVVAACLPHQFKGCAEHMREHDTRCSHVPAAAPAAEDGHCMARDHSVSSHPKSEDCVDWEAEPALGYVPGVTREAEDRETPTWEQFKVACPVPPSEPAAPEKEIANLLGRGHVRNPREGEPGDAETYSSPAPLLPRVLAALDGASRLAAAHGWLDRVALLDALADELRAYIAKAKGEGT